MLKQTSIFVLFTALFLTACGQSGALYFPENKAVAPTETRVAEDKDTAVKTTEDLN